MAEYTYICPEGHHRQIEEGMFSNVDYYCVECGGKMWRKPQMPAVNWGGLSPSQGELAPVIQDMVDHEDKNRDNYLAKKETTNGNRRHKDKGKT